MATTDKLVKLEQLATFATQTKTYVENAEGKIKVTSTHFNIPSGQTFATVKDALDQLVSEQSDAAIEVQTIAGASGDAYSKKYKIWTGEIDKTKTGDDRYTKATLLGEIDIPKDMVVEAGAVVTLTEAEAQAKTGDPSAVAGKYIELTIANKTSDKIYIYVGSLVDIYTAEDTDSVDMDITDNKIKADVKISAKANNAASILATAGEEGLYVENTASDVSTLKTVVGDASSGLVKDTTDLKTAVGDSTSGLVKDTDDLKTTVGDSTSGLVKDTADNKTAIASLPIDAASGEVEYATDADIEDLFK